MEAAPLHTLCDVLADARFALLYSGRFPDSHTASLINLAEEAGAQARADKGLRTRLAFVLVEAYQNIIRHRSLDDTEAGRSLLLLRIGPGQQEVLTMNPVANTERSALEKRLADLEGMDAHALRNRSREHLSQGARTQRGGAGLGLLGMARRAKVPLAHTFVPIDGQHMRFTLHVQPSGEGSPNPLRPELLFRLACETRLILACTLPVDAATGTLLHRLVRAEVEGAHALSDEAEKVLSHLLTEARTHSIQQSILAVHVVQDAPVLSWVVPAPRVRDAARWPSAPPGMATGDAGPAHHSYSVLL